MSEGGISEEEARDALRHVAEKTGAVDPDEDDPFTCPVCRGSVVVKGNGARDCKNCTWEKRPNQEKETQQSGINQFQE